MPGDCLRMNIAGSEYRDLLEPVKIISALKLLSNDIRIVLIIRRQWDWLRSRYQECVKRYETRNFLNIIKAGVFRNTLARLDYGSVIVQYEDAFGKENIRVIPFELLASDPLKFKKSLEESIGDLILSSSLARHKTGLRRPFVI